MEITIIVKDEAGQELHRRYKYGVIDWNTVVEDMKDTLNNPVEL